jgi:hypothetical protein
MPREFFPMHGIRKMNDDFFIASNPRFKVGKDSELKDVLWKP